MSELGLIQQALNGNTSCFEQLIFLYEKQLMRFLKLRCNCVSDAEDVFQETFLNAHLYLQSYQQKYAFSTWLFNISLNVIKRQARAHKDTFYPTNLAQETAQQTNVEPQANTDNIWHIAKLHLNNEQLCLLWFTYAEEYTGKEVASLLQRSLPWVKINLIRAKNLLREKMSEVNLDFSDMARGYDHDRQNN